MFEGCLELALDFVGVQPVDRGCSSVELSDFICEDLLPYQGWAANAMLRDTVVRLLLETRADAFGLYTASAGQSHASSTAAASSAKLVACGAGRAKPSKNTAAAAGPSHAPHCPITAADALERLDSGRLLWSTTTAQSAASSSPTPPIDTANVVASSIHAGASLVFFTPSRALRERVLCIPIHNEKQEMISRFVVEHAIQGWEKVPYTPEFKARYKSHHVTNGLKWLQRLHKVSLRYLYHAPTRSIVYRFFPHFALPLTEREKVELPETASSLFTARDQNSAGDADEEVSAAPESVAVRRQYRRYHPLDHYFARQRANDPAFPAVVFDLQLVRHLVLQSPERRLLVQDAVHVIFAAHRLFTTRWEDFGKNERMHLRRMMDCAGLCNVVASITLRGHRRVLRLVLPVEDLRAHQQGEGGEGHAASASVSPTSRKRPRTQEGSDDSGSDEGHQSDGDSDGAPTTERERRRGALLLGGSARGVPPSDTYGAAHRSAVAKREEDEDDEDGSGSDEERNRQLNSLDDSTNDGNAAGRSITRHVQEEASAVLRIEPGFTVEVQAAQEAERRPLALTAVFPRIRVEMAEKQRGKLMSSFMERYIKARGTLDTHYTLMKHSKVFTLVYAPQQTPAAVSVPPQDPPTTADTRRATVKEEPADPETPCASLTSAHSTQRDSTVAPASAARSISAAATDPAANLFRFEPKDSRLPKGVSAYSVNTVLDVLLHATPHHAASLPRLTRAIDITTLQRRVLPLLRELRYVYTTGVAERGRKHVGMVVLRASLVDPCASTDVLDDEAKRAVLEAESSAATAHEAARPPQPPSGKAVVTDMVLDAVPTVLDGVLPSATAQGLLKAHPMATKAVNRVVAVRNGYARSALQRISRLHLELWVQHYWYPAEPAAEAGAQGTGVRVTDMFERMSLSTYCIVVGLPQGDLASVLGSISSSSSGNVPDVGSMHDGTYGWSTPVKALPPSLYGWCVQQGMQMICMCLEELRGRQLVRSTGTADFSALLQVDTREKVRYSLCAEGVLDGCTYHFLSTPPSASASVYACMRYWLPVWNAIPLPQKGPEEALLEAVPNPSVLQVVALARVTRRETGLVAALLHQNCGVSRSVRRSHHFGELHASKEFAALGIHRKGRATLAAAAGYGTTAGSRHREHGHHLDRIEGGLVPFGESNAAPHGYVGAPMRKTARTEVGGANVATILEYAFHHFAPLRRVEELLRLLLRARQHQMAQHSLFCVPPALPMVLRSTPGVGGSGGSASASPTDAASSTCGTVCQSEFNTTHSQQGGGTYNRMLSTAIVHMAALGETLRAVRHGHAGRHEPQHVSSTDALKAEVTTVFAPQLALSESPETADNTLLAAQMPLRTIGPAVSHAREAIALHRRQQQQEQAAGLEVVADVLRMVLLSDQAHYRATTARALLAALTAPWLTSRARALLQKLPVFRRTKRRNSRVPLLSLVLRPFVLPSSALRGGLRPCANLAALHQWTQEADIVGAALAGSPTRWQGGGESHNIMRALLRAETPAVELPSSAALSLELLHQPSLELSQLSMAPNVVVEAMTRVPLPQLAWSQAALLCERMCRDAHAGAFPSAASAVAADGEERGGHTRLDGTNASGAAGVHSRRHRKRARGSDSGAHENEDDSDADYDDNQAVQRVEEEATRLLYPARTVRNDGDPLRLLDLPIDNAPTPAELQAVERGRTLLSSGAYTVLCGPVASAPYGIAYPSVFHHVDGSFHVYMWQLVVHTVYRYVLRVPGIQHADLECRLMASGVLSQRAVRAVLRFLEERQLLACKEAELAGSLCVPGCGVCEPMPRVRSPFARERQRTAPSSAQHTSDASLPTEAEAEAVERRCYFAVAPLEALELAMSAPFC